MSSIPVDDEMLRLLASNCARAYRTWVERLGKRTRVWDDLSCADLELAVPLPPNGATLLREPDDDVLERISGFFGERPGGRYEIWSLWPIPALATAGVVGDPVPCMIRDPGASSPDAPAELEIVEAKEETAIRDAEALINDVYGARSEPGSLLTLGCLDESFRVWVGYVEHRPVTTAAAYIDDRFVGTYAVATAPDSRGHGYGEAVTWAATLCRPEMPATLQASAMGRPIYKRMGFRTVAEFTVWERGR
jgi:GNAT superfamily N-acetyltransferase